MPGDYEDRCVPPDRCMAQIVKIVSLETIRKAEKVELATVLGWQCVVRKNEFKVGDLAVYISLDSVLDPQNPHFTFLQGDRLRTRKIFGCVSQGLLGPLTWLPSTLCASTVKEGDDVTSSLPLKKYVPPMEMSIYESETKDKASLPFPTFVPRTDEERIQNMPSVTERLIGQPVIITRKEDGTSITLCYCNGTFIICTRNNAIDRKLEPTPNTRPYLDIAKKHDLEAKLKAMVGESVNIAIQAELVGPKINGGKVKVKENELRVYNVWDIENMCYLPWEKVTDICAKLELKTVPLVYAGPYKSDWNVATLLTMAEDTKLDYVPGSPAEGIVVKTNHTGKERPRVSFKVISRRFLLKNS